MNVRFFTIEDLGFWIFILPFSPIKNGFKTLILNDPKNKDPLIELVKMKWKFGLIPYLLISLCVCGQKITNVAHDLFGIISRNNLSGWLTKNPGHTDVFIKNYGQFDSYLKPINRRVEFALINNEKVFFTRNGCIWMLDKQIKSGLSGGKEDDEKNEIESFFVNMTWEGANPDAQLISEEMTEGYYTYAAEGFTDLKAKGYKKLIYKNMYPGIDIEYIIPEGKGGIKYSFILKPGVDIKNVKMVYTGDFEKVELLNNGNVSIMTKCGNIIDHAPDTYYSEDQSKVKCSFRICGKNVLGFCFPAGYDDFKSVTIDPWTTSPNLYSGTGAFDVGYDSYGNEYVGFVSANVTQISKYSTTGAFLWTINLASLSKIYSKFCVIPSGSLFIASGSNNPGVLAKISSVGVFLNSVMWPFILGDEGWVLNYNRCSNMILIGGCGGSMSNNIISLRMGVDSSLSGTFTGTNFNNGQAIANDMACMKLDNNGDMYSYFAAYIKAGTNNTIYRSAPPYNSIIFSQFRTGCSFEETSSIPVCSFNSCNRLNVMDVNNDYLFFFDGQNIEARSKSNGSLLASMVVSAAYTCGGIGNQPTYKNEGVAADDCNNVYIGGRGLIHILNFDGANFNRIDSIVVPNNVYDISLDKSKQIVYVVGLNFAGSFAALPCNSSLAINSTSFTPCGADSGNASVTVSGGIKPYTYKWSNGDSLSSISDITGTYVVTISDATCSNYLSSTSAVKISANPFPKPIIEGNTIICEGQSTELTVSGGETYKWANGAPDSSITVSPKMNTTYTVVVYNGLCKSDDTIRIRVKSAPDIVVCCDTSIKEGKSVNLSASGGISYLWSPAFGLSCPNCFNPTASPDITTIYTVTVTNDSGCAGSTSLNVNILCGDVFVPKAFSPNKDGENDILYARGTCMESCDFLIFNRWGEKLFESNEKSIGWDGSYKGTLCNTDVFTYYLKARMYDGSEITKEGHVTLLR